MNQYLLFLVLGVGTGALYAGLAQGILVAYRGSGVVNLAQGAIAMYGAYTFYELRSTGGLVLPPLPNPLAIVAWMTRITPTLATVLASGGA